MIRTPTLMVAVAFTYATAIFHTLLSVERRVWRSVITTNGSTRVSEDDTRFAHRILKRLSGWLPACNGVVILLGLPGLIWQAAALSWSVPSLVVLGFWISGAVWILAAGRIARLVSDLRPSDRDSLIAAPIPVLRGPIRQHFNGVLHASGTLLLQIVLIARPGV